MSIRASPFFVLLSCIWLALPVATHAGVILSEVNWSGSSLSSSDEWIELRNTDADEQDVGQWSVYVNDTQLELPIDARIPPLGTYIVSNYDAPSDKSALTEPPDLVMSKISLPNSGFTLELVNRDGDTVDRADLSKLPSRSASDAHRSLIRQQEETIRDAWHDATEHLFLLNTGLDYGTPTVFDRMVSSSSVFISPSATTATATSTLPDLHWVNDAEGSVVGVPCPLRLRAVTASTYEQREWIELEGCLAANIRSYGWHIDRDAKPIVKIDDDTVMDILDAESVRVYLPNGSLPDRGSTLYVRDAQDRTWQGVRVPSLKKDETFQRQADASWIRSERQDVFGVALEEEYTSLVSATSTVRDIAASNSSTLFTASTSLMPPKIPTTIVQSFAMSDMEEERPQLTLATAIPKSASSKSVKSSAKPKTTVKTTSSSSKEVKTILQGIVGTPKGLVGKNRFVLLTADGSGTMILGNGKQQTPPQGIRVTVRGALITNDDGTELRVRADDQWNALSTTPTTTMARTIDWSDPQDTDAWSLVDVDGIVSDTRTSSFTLDVNGEDVDVVIKPSVGYRAQRLHEGDTVHVRGILDMGQLPYKLYPRDASEITIAKEAAHATNAAPPKTATLPPWLPIGAAAGAIAALEGMKKLHALYKQRQHNLSSTLAKNEPKHV